METKTMKYHTRKVKEFLLVVTMALLYYFALAGPGVPQIEILEER